MDGDGAPACGNALTRQPGVLPIQFLLETVGELLFIELAGLELLQVPVQGPSQAGQHYFNQRLTHVLIPVKLGSTKRTTTTASALTNSSSDFKQSKKMCQIAIADHSKQG